MIKKLRIVLFTLALAALCAGFAACSSSKNELENYDVLVHYDSNGGMYYKEGVSIVDGYKFSDYQADANGTYRFKLIEPTDASRPKKVTLTKKGHFFAGWYKTRTIVLDADGKAFDEQGRPIEESDGNYYVVNEDGYFIDKDGKPLVERDDGYYYLVGSTDDVKNRRDRVLSEPCYNYEDLWDFSSDRFECTEDGDRELTLYAGWVPYYYFNYYVQNPSGEWEKYAETYFDYKVANAQNSDYDTIWVPRWNNGVMDHKHRYSDDSDYKFPEIEGRTFIAAYTDEACTHKIEDSLIHEGTLDVAHAKAENRVQNIYVRFENVERFRIETAQQLADNAKTRGYYTIINDLDFTGVE